MAYKSILFLFVAPVLEPTGDVLGDAQPVGNAFHYFTVCTYMLRSITYMTDILFRSG